MNQVPTEYKTVSFYRAVWLKMHGFPLLRVEKVDDRQARFVFPVKDNLHELLAEFDASEGKAAVLQDAIGAQKELKAAMYDVLGDRPKRR